MIKLENVSKIYSTNGNVSVGIRKVNLEFKRGEFVAITGESGSGKSTLLNIISGIDTYEEGEMYVAGEETSCFNISDLEDYRNKYVGFIFQNYNVVDSYTVLENVEAALLFLNYSKEERIKKAKELIDRVGLSSRINTKASKLSGGEKQRTVIARALAKDPMIIAADEPTGNLDTKSSIEIIELLHEISQDKLVLIVTHDFSEVQNYATRLIRVYDSEIKDDIKIKDIQKDDIPNLLDEPKKSASFKNILNISFMDLFSSFKRFLFYLIVFLILSISSLTSLSSYKTASNLLTNFAYDDFMNADSTRVVLNKIDHSAFSDDEINKIKNNSLVNEVILNDLIVDKNAYVYYETETGFYSNYDSFFKSASVLEKSDLTYGELPNKKDEVVLTLSFLTLNNEYKNDYFIGKEVDVSGYKCKIVGLINKDNLSNDKGSYVYISDELLDDLIFDEYVNYSKLVLVDNEDNVLEYNFSLVSCNDVVSENNEAKYIIYGIHGYPENGTYKASIKDYYQEYFSNDNFEIEFVLADDNTNPAYDEFDGETLVVSENLYNTLKSAYLDKTYQISVFTEFSKDTITLRDSLRFDGYNGIAPYYDSSSNVMFDSINNLINALYVTIFALGIIAEIFFVYLIMRHSIISKKADFEILRTIGASKNNVNFMMLIELIITSLISYLVTVLLYVILFTFVKGEFKDYLSNIELIDFIVLFIVDIIFPVILSYLFSKKIFNKSVRASLSERRN